MNQNADEEAGIDVLLTEPILGGELDAGALDGSAVVNGELMVSLDGGEAAYVMLDSVEDHKANIAEFMDEKELSDIAQKVIDWVDEDTRARADWETALKNGMQTLGIAPLEQDDAPFDGASTVTHPLILEAAIQYASRAIEELFPSTGPVKCKTVPNPTPEILQQADRVEHFFNFYLTEEDEGYYDDTDQMLLKKALEGHIFRKVYICPLEGKVKARHVSASDLIVPYSASSLVDADHYTNRFNYTLNDLRKAIETGYYRDVEFSDSAFGEIKQDAERENADQADRREPLFEDSIPELLECHCYLSIPGVDDDVEVGGGKIAYPYVVTVERHTQEVLSIYRNWREDDMRRRKRVWFASYKYLQGLGFYGFGLYHVLGNIAASSGSMLRSLLDAAALNNLQGGFVAKMGGGRKMDLEIEHGVWKEIDLTPEELQKAFYSPPFRSPDQTLMLGLRDMVETARRFSSTTESMVGEGPRSGPVGTTLAMIEQGSKVFTAIHKRMHKSFQHELRCMQELFKEIGQEYPYPVGDFSLVQDLDDRVDVIPVSDPTIVSNTQRIAMAQAAQQIVRADPELYGPQARRMADLELMRVMRVPNAELLMREQEPEQPPEMNPVSENAAIITGKPVKAYQEQDHDAHIQTHITFAQSLPPEGQKAVEGPMLAHIAEHAAMKYQNYIAESLKTPQAMQAMQAGITPEQIVASLPVPPLVPQMMPGEGIQ